MGVSASSSDPRRLPLRLLGFVLTASLVGAGLAFSLRLFDAAESSPGAAEEAAGEAVFAAQPAPTRTGGRRRDRRIPLYLVSSKAEQRHMERALVATGYIELNGGDFAGPWVVMVMDGITLQDVENLNLARIWNGELPYRVVDAR